MAELHCGWRVGSAISSGSSAVDMSDLKQRPLYSVSVRPWVGVPPGGSVTLDETTPLSSGRFLEETWW